MRAVSVGAVLVGLMTGAAAVGQPPAAQPEKRYRFEVSDAPWPKVFEQLTEMTGKPLISVYKPTGSFSFKGPPGKEYTVREIVDIINEGLGSKDQPSKYCLIQRE